MPFDIAPNTDQQIEARIALSDLAYALRHTKEHDWFFGHEGSVKSHCGTSGCAIGLARAVPSCCAIWDIGSEYSEPLFANDLPKSLVKRGMPAKAVASFFYGGRFGGISQCGGEAGIEYANARDVSDVTQAMVADRIEHWLATGEIR